MEKLSKEETRERFVEYILMTLYDFGKDLTQADRKAIAEEVLDRVEMIEED